MQQSFADVCFSLDNLYAYYAAVSFLFRRGIKIF